MPKGTRLSIHAYTHSLGPFTYWRQGRWPLPAWLATSSKQATSRCSWGPRGGATLQLAADAQLYYTSCWYSHPQVMKEERPETTSGCQYGQRPLPVWSAASSVFALEQRMPTHVAAGTNQSDEAYASISVATNEPDRNLGLLFAFSFGELKALQFACWPQLCSGGPQFFPPLPPDPDPTPGSDQVSLGACRIPS